MKRLTTFAVAVSFAWLVGSVYAQQGTGQGQMQQEQKQEQKQTQKKQTKKKCPAGQVYNKKEKKCLPKPAASSEAPKSGAATAAPQKSPAADAAPSAKP